MAAANRRHLLCTFCTRAVSPAPLPHPQCLRSDPTPTPHALVLQVSTKQRRLDSHACLAPPALWCGWGKG